jgi:hypothetical protein
VQFATLLDHLPADAEGVRKVGGAVAGDWKPGAPRRAIRREGGEDGDSAIRAGSHLESIEISSAILVGGHEMEERSVMPHKVAPRWSPGTYVPYQPLHTFGSITKPVLGGTHTGERDVEHREI